MKISFDGYKLKKNIYVDFLCVNVNLA